MSEFTGVKVFSATTFSAHQVLGEHVTEWIKTHPEIEIMDKLVTQSSDQTHHCIVITLFYCDKPKLETIEAPMTPSNRALESSYRKAMKKP